MFQPQPQAPYDDEDGMNEYLESYQENPDVSMDPSPIKFAELGAIPKTPLQRLLNQEPMPLVRIANTANNANTTQSPPQTAAGAGITAMNNNDNFLKVMQRQNDIAVLLVLQHKQTSLPPREIPVFNGNPLNYQIFMKAF